MAQESLGEVFGVGVGEWEVVEFVLGGLRGSAEIGVFESSAVVLAGAERVDLLSYGGFGAGVEGMEVGVCIGGRDIDEFLEPGR